MNRINEVDRILQGKVRLVKASKANHDHFSFPKTLGIGLPVILALSHGNREISETNLKGLADGLGMRKDEFLQSLQCHIGRNVIYLCLASHLLRWIEGKFQADPIVHEAGCRAMNRSVLNLLGQVEKPFTPNKHEIVVLNRLRAEIEGRTSHEFVSTFKLIDKFMIDVLSGR